jgi:glycosyltransferase involved in cell wall biosynthesis
LQRFGRLAGALRIAGDRAYLVEQRSFAPWVYSLARLRQADVIHLHDPGLMNAVWHARRTMGGTFAIAFTNGGWLSPEHLHRPDLVHTVTPVDAERLRVAGFSNERVAMVPYGIDLSVVPDRIFDDGRSLRLIGVGSLNDFSKGFATAIRAAAELKDVTLRLIGQRDEQTAEIEMLGRQFLGPRFSTDTLPPEGIPGALTSADVFVLPTHSEGFCIAVLEAMALGLPCVVSDIPVLKWLVGNAALTVPPDRPDLWANTLAQLTAERRRELSLAGRIRAAEFGWRRLAPNYVAMFEQTIETRARWGRSR